MPIEQPLLRTAFSPDRYLTTIESNQSENRYIYPIASGRLVHTIDSETVISAVTNTASPEQERYQRVLILHDNGYASIYMGNFIVLHREPIISESQPIAILQNEAAFLFALYDVERHAWINPYFVFMPEVARSNHIRYNAVLKNTHESLFDRSIVTQDAKLQIYQQPDQETILPIAEQVFLNEILIKTNYFTHVLLGSKDLFPDTAITIQVTEDFGVRGDISIRPFYSETNSNSQAFFFRIVK